MANKLDTNPIVIDTFAAGDIIISTQEIKIFMAQIFTNGAVGDLTFSDLAGNYKFALATVAADTTDHLEFHFPMYSNSLKINTGHNMPAGSFLMIQVGG